MHTFGDFPLIGKTGRVSLFMRRLPILSRPLPLSFGLACFLLAAAAAAPAQNPSQPAPAAAGASPRRVLPASSPQPLPDRASSQEVFSGYTTSPSPEKFPGFAASPSPERFPGYSASRVDTSLLSAIPYVYALKRDDPAQMKAEDAGLLQSLQPQLHRQAALLSFNLSTPGWSFQQVLCPALPDYVLLSFVRGPSPSGSSRFTAILERDNPRVEIVSTFAHGMKPFTAAWSKPSTFRLFNRMLRRERGARSLATAPNWLVIGMCYAELSGYPVQVLTSEPEPDPTLNLERLHGKLPQMEVAADHSAEISFSDVSQPSVTAGWLLRFDRSGRIVAAQIKRGNQPARARLGP